MNNQIEMNFKHADPDQVKPDAGTRHRNLSDKTNAAIAQSHDHANAAIEGWADQAIGFVRSFPKDRFFTNEVAQYARERGLPEPPDRRAWGGVMIRAKKNLVVRSDGFGYLKTEGKANDRPMTVWVKIEWGDQ